MGLRILSECPDSMKKGDHFDHQFNNVFSYTTILFTPSSKNTKVLKKAYIFKKGVLLDGTPLISTYILYACLIVKRQKRKILKFVKRR